MCQRKDLIELDISVENAMTLLISAGMVQPDKRRSEETGGAGDDRPCGAGGSLTGGREINPGTIPMPLLRVESGC